MTCDMIADVARTEGLTVQRMGAELVEAGRPAEGVWWRARRSLTGRWCLWFDDGAFATLCVTEDPEAVRTALRRDMARHRGDVARGTAA